MNCHARFELRWQQATLVLFFFELAANLTNLIRSKAFLFKLSLLDDLHQVRYWVFITVLQNRTLTDLNYQFNCLLK